MSGWTSDRLLRVGRYLFALPVGLFGVRRRFGAHRKGVCIRFPQADCVLPISEPPTSRITSRRRSTSSLRKR